MGMAFCLRRKSKITKSFTEPSAVFSVGFSHTSPRMNDLPAQRCPQRLSRIARGLFGSLLLASLLCVQAKALSVIPPSFQKLVSSSDQIVRVEITGSRCQWDETPSGQKVIHTYLACRVSQVLKGEAPATLTLRFLGGRADGLRMVVHDMPELENGAEYILFVGQNGQAFCPLVGANHGGYRIQREAATGQEHLSRLDGMPLRSTSDVARPLGAYSLGNPDLSGMSPENLAIAIRSEVANAH